MLNIKIKNNINKISLTIILKVFLLCWLGCIKICSFSFASANVFEDYSTPTDGKIPFEKVVTLGDSCLNKWQINAFFQKHYPQFESFTRSYIFDWVIPTKLELLKEAINNKLENIAQVEIKTLEGHGLKLVDQYGIVYNHMFDNENNKVKQDGTLCPNLLKEFYPTIKGKIEYLKTKTLKVLMGKQKTLYTLIGPRKNNDHNFQIENIIGLRDAILRINPTADFQLLVIIHKGFYLKDDHLQASDRIIIKKVSSWSDNATLYDDWEKVLMQFAFKENDETKTTIDPFVSSGAGI